MDMNVLAWEIIGLDYWYVIAQRATMRDWVCHQMRKNDKRVVQTRITPTLSLAFREVGEMIEAEIREKRNTPAG